MRCGRRALMARCRPLRAPGGLRALVAALALSLTSSSRMIRRWGGQQCCTGRLATYLALVFSPFAVCCHAARGRLFLALAMGLWDSWGCGGFQRVVWPLSCWSEQRTAGRWQPQPAICVKGWDIGVSGGCVVWFGTHLASVLAFTLLAAFFTVAVMLFAAQF
ncbi:hypothetical protein BDZ97DRAFT_1848161 [Flammula alnicola]|nr:hypothetical protein BDZ97DRAFT_1896634 [Flammula alnicola]KAF8957048.1 hypothetical protein BDZ97DRAFT_1848155 [Flammula alnicola]KAF8957051.1 hypothetical protein BDZ97DRAFT_1848161 [Flammula alnicola]